MEMNVMLDSGAWMPERAHATDAGLDLKTPRELNVYSGDSAIVDTGVHIELPHGYFGQIVSKSGLNMKQNIVVTGTIDEGYTGPIVVKLYNLAPESYIDHMRTYVHFIDHMRTYVHFNAGDKIAQLLILPYATPSLRITGKFKETERGDAGFGSTGR